MDKHHYPKVTLETNVNELISTYPESVEVLIEYGIPCASCHFSSYDTINDSVIEFGLEEEDTEELLEQLNELVEETDKEKKTEEESISID